MRAKINFNLLMVYCGISILGVATVLIGVLNKDVWLIAIGGLNIITPLYYLLIEPRKLKRILGSLL